MQRRSTFVRNIMLVNRAFWRNAPFLVLLFVLPVIIAVIAFFASNNPFIFNQSFAPVTTIDLLLIGFLVIPIYIKHFNSSVLIVFDKYRTKEKITVIKSMIFYFSMLAIFFYLYSFLVIFLFSLRKLSNDIYYESNNEQLIYTFQLLFTDRSICSPELGISNYISKQWIAFTFVNIASFYYYIICALTFYNFIRDENILNFTLLIICFVSIADSGFLVSPSMIKQHIAYQIISYLTISSGTLSFATFFCISGRDINPGPNVYATRDFDFSYPLLPNNEAIIFIVIIVLFNIVYCASIYYKKKSSKDNLAFNKIDPYDNVERQMRLVFQIGKNGKREGIDLGDGEHVVLEFKNLKELGLFVKDIKKKYNVFDFYQYQKDKFYGTGVFLNNNINRISEFSIYDNFENLFSHYEKTTVYQMWEDFKYIIQNSKTTSTKDIHWFDEYFATIVYLLNMDIQFLVLEWIGSLDEGALTSIGELAKQKDKNVIFLVTKRSDRRSRQSKNRNNEASKVVNPSN